MLTRRELSPTPRRVYTREIEKDECALLRGGKWSAWPDWDPRCFPVAPVCVWCWWNECWCWSHHAAHAIHSFVFTFLQCRRKCSLSPVRLRGGENAGFLGGASIVATLSIKYSTDAVLPTQRCHNCLSCRRALAFTPTLLPRRQSGRRHAPSGPSFQTSPSAGILLRGRGHLLAPECGVRRSINERVCSVERPCVCAAYACPLLRSPRPILLRTPPALLLLRLVSCNSPNSSLRCLQRGRLCGRGCSFSSGDGGRS